MGILKRFYIKRFLRKWSETAKQEYKNLNIIRSYSCNEFYVDLNWDIVSVQRNCLVENMFFRCKWENVKEFVGKYESTELSEILKEYSKQ